MEMFDLTARRARLSPNALALEDLGDGTTYTYRQLNERAARAAAAATTHWGLKAGDRLAYLGGNRAEFFVLLFACAKAGLILVPLNWRLTEPELRLLLDDCTPGALVHTRDMAPMARTLAKGHAAMTLIALDPEPDHDRQYGADLDDSTPDLAPHPNRPANDTWYLIYTSGTTGKPKGVIQTFAMLLTNYLNIGLAISLRDDDTLLNVLPLFHTAGVNLYSSAVFLVGGTVLVQRGFDPAATLSALANRCTVFFGVPAVYQALIDHPDFNGERLAKVRSWGCGGAALSLPVAQRYAGHGILVRTGMGMTETGPTVFLLDEEHVLSKAGSVGHPQLFAQVRIVDAQGRDVPAGEAGELLIKGPGITPGYWRRPDATREAFTADGWLRSGDVARCDPDGFYYIVDRWKDMYISGGENVYPAEVESVLLLHPAIAEAAVVGVPDERWGETGVAFLVPRPGRDIPVADALKTYCREQLAGYKVPGRFKFVDALPRNALGKVIKQELRNAAL